MCVNNTPHCSVNSMQYNGDKVIQLELDFQGSYDNTSHPVHLNISLVPCSPGSMSSDGTGTCTRVPTEPCDCSNDTQCPSNNYTSQATNGTCDCQPVSPTVLYNCTDTNSTCDCDTKPTGFNNCTSGNDSKIPPHIIHVQTLACPVGFQLTEYNQCGCISFLKKYDIRCKVTDQTISRRGSVWVGAENGSVMVSTHCSPNYCKQEDTDIHLTQPDMQCAFNRSGILCGGCAPGLSITLGTPECRTCSDKYIALILPFAFMGVALIVFMLLLDLNVSVGAINGFILYANIVQENYSVFFTPLETEVSTLKQILTIFISWPNLDLGIKTCFYSGMDMFAKTWLEVVFPAYLCTLAGLLVLICKHIPTRFKKYLGRPSAAIFATILLLSYAKLLRVVIAIMTSVYVDREDGSNTLVWLYDGNLPFLSGRHIALFVMALVVLLAFIIPYTLLLLFTPCLQSLTKFRACRWVDSKNFKPLLDAYQAPFKKRSRYWPGLMVLVRFGLFVSFAITAHFETTQVNLLVIATVVMCILTLMWLMGTVYESFTINLAEAAFIFNLGVLSIWSLYGRSGATSPPKQYIITYTMVAVAMVMFALILVYHVYLSIDWLWEWVKTHRNERKESDSEVHMFSASDFMSETLLPEVHYTEVGTSTFIPAGGAAKVQEEEVREKGSEEEIVKIKEEND